jgi:hypothetical protein
VGQLFSQGGLTVPNSAISDPDTGQMQAVNPKLFAQIRDQGALDRSAQSIAPPPAAPNMSMGPGGQPSFSTPDNTPQTYKPPKPFQPSFIQAATAGAQPGGVNALSPQLSKLGKLGVLLTQGVQGALAGRAANEEATVASGGRRSGGIGMAMEAGYNLPFLRSLQQQQVQRGGLENQMLQNQVQYAPLLQRLGIMKAGADISKTQAEGEKAGAEAAAVPTKQALESAQTEAAFYKDDPNLGLIDLRTQKPVSNAGYAPLSAQEAQILGKQPGDNVPLKIKNSANEMVNRGIRPVQAGGRSLLVDNQGNTIKDMGQATPLVVANYNNPFSQPGAFPVGTGDDVLKGLTPQQQTLVKGVANYTVDPNSLVSQRGRGKADLLGLVKQYDPSYDETQYGTKSALRKSFTSGPDSQNIKSLNTVAHHLDQLDQANDALNNGNTQLLNQIANAYNVKVAGKSAPVVFNAVKNAVSGELGSIFKNSGATDPEIANIGSTISDSLSKGINKDVISTDVGLVQGRLKALQFKYENGMGKPADFKIISPEAEQAFNRLGGQGQGTSPSGNEIHYKIVNGQLVRQ